MNSISSIVVSTLPMISYFISQVEYLVGIVAVHLGILLRKLRLVSVGGHKVFKWMSDNGKH